MDWGNCLDKSVDQTAGVAKLSCLPALFQNIVTTALMFAGIVALFFIMYAGIKFITSSGDPKQLEPARKTLTFAILGLVIVLLAFFIIDVIGFLTGTSSCLRTFKITGC